MVRLLLSPSLVPESGGARPSRPDAVKIPNGDTDDPVWNMGRRMQDVIADLAEKHLKAGPVELVHIADTLWGFRLATRTRGATLLYPFGHPKQGQDRYHWEKHPDGIEYGYLLEPEPCRAS